jgi:hypothetical protein
MESIPSNAWTESGRTPVLTESSNSRLTVHAHDQTRRGQAPHDHPGMYAPEWPRRTCTWSSTSLEGRRPSGAPWLWLPGSQAGAMWRAGTGLE